MPRILLDQKMLKQIKLTLRVIVTVFDQFYLAEAKFIDTNFGQIWGFWTIGNDVIMTFLKSNFATFANFEQKSMQLLKLLETKLLF